MDLRHPACEIAPRERFDAASFTECFIDELARAAWRDPVQYRREMLTGGVVGEAAAGRQGASRLCRVLDEAARLSGWSRLLAPGEARGIALGLRKGAVAAYVADVSWGRHGQPQVGRVVAVVDGAGGCADDTRRHLQQRIAGHWACAGRAPQLQVALLGSAVTTNHEAHDVPGLEAALANAVAMLRHRRQVEEQALLSEVDT